MSRFAFKPLRSFGSWAFVVWLAALIIFLLWLGWVFFSGDPEEERAARTPRDVAEGFTDVSVLELPEREKIKDPHLPFDPQQAYVLAGAGLQGMYMNAAPEDVWTLSSSDPVMVAQVIKRGPPMPRRMTRGIEVHWELAGATDGAQPLTGIMDAVEDSHFEASIPASPLATDGTPEPFRIIRLRAVDAYDGRLFAQSAAVLALSPGFGCAHCHENAGIAILEAHDRHESTKLERRHARGEIIACRSCHGGEGGPDEPGADATGTDGEAIRADLSLSAAIHGWHAPFLAGRAEDACMTCHIGMVKTGDDPQTEPQPLFARDFHIDRGLNCVRCHGYMEDHALALLKTAHEAGKVVASRAMDTIPARETTVEKIRARVPWQEQPDCTGCHDFAHKPDLINASAFNKWSSSLFSERKDNMSMVRCVTCHGAPHAVYPARNPLSANLDNLPPLQYQEQAAPFGDYGNCAMCHGAPRDVSAHHPLVTWSDTEVHIPAGVERLMPAARFPHSAHVQVVSCNTCHHTGHEDGASLLCTSSGCHDGVTDTSETEGAGQAYRYFYNAFHGEFPSCLGCHTESLAARKPAGPTDCQACHQAPSARWDTAPGAESGTAEASGEEPLTSTGALSDGSPEASPDAAKVAPPDAAKAR